MADDRLIRRSDVYNLFEPNGTAKLHVGDIDTIPTVDALIPPCKPWDKVWVICKTLDRVDGGLTKTICEGEIIKLSYNGFTTPMEWLDYRYDSPLVGQTVGHDRIDLCLGKTVFLNREEAEAALAKMNGGAEDDI